MTGGPVSRRGVFGQISSGCGCGIALGQAPSPEKAWIIVALGWEYNDEFTFQEGEYALPHVYFDKTRAEAECQRLIAEFFTQETPAQFEVDWGDFFPDGVDNERAVTWDDVRAAGFPAPYYVLELSATGGPLAGVPPDE